MKKIFLHYILKNQEIRYWLTWLFSSSVYILSLDYAILFYFCCCCCILSFGVHVQDMQDSCIGTHMAVWFAVFLPFTHIWHFSSCYPSPAPPPHCPSHIPPNRPQCVMLPSLCPCVLIFQHPPLSNNMRCLIFCSCVSLLRMMISRFIHVPTKDMNSSFFMAA